jgi:hypothetical protein
MEESKRTRGQITMHGNPSQSVGGGRIALWIARLISEVDVMFMARFFTYEAVIIMIDDFA